MYFSIRWRIIVPYTVLILFSVAGVGIYLNNSFYQTQLAAFQARLRDDALLIRESLQYNPEDTATAPELVERAKHWAEILDLRVTIIGADGQVLAESHHDPQGMDNHLDRPEIQEALTTGLGSNIRYSQTLNYDLLYVAVPINADAASTGLVRVSLPLEAFEVSQIQLRNTILAVTAITGGLAVLLSILIATRVTRPLHALTQAAQKMTREESTRHIPSLRHDEVGQLTHAFNALVSKLQTQIHALQAERGKLSSVLEQMTDGVIIVNAQGHITLINQAAERMFSTDTQKALRSSLAQIVRQHQWIELWQDCQESGEELSATLELPRQGTFIQGIALPLSDALPGHTLMLFQDLTRLRRLETVRRDFISNISHELRTPLASLKALTETLQSGALEDPPAARRFLARMETEVDALTHMVSELLELTRIESGQVPLELKTISPRDLLILAHDRLKLQAERAQIELILACPGDLPLIQADPPRLGQVLVNLLHNAIKFTPEAGQIRLSAEVKGEDIVFTVQDTGVGIPADDVPRIFERFYKTDRARASGGTGLGLAIARHLVEAHGGRIWVDSIEEQGSTFYFTIPVAE